MKESEPAGSRISAVLEMERQQRHIILYAVSAIGIVITIAMGAVAAAESVLHLTVADFSVTLVLVLNVIFFQRLYGYWIATTIGIGFSGVFFLFLLLTGGSQVTGHLWAFTFPLYATFLLGTKRGIVAMSTFLGVSVVVFLAPFGASLRPDYGVPFIIRFLVSFLVVSAFSLVFEIVRARVQRAVLVKNSLLEQSNADLRAVHEDLLRMAQSRSAMISELSHELRTPLGHILGFGDVLKSESVGSLNDDQKEYLNDVLASARHLLNITKNILDFAKNENSEQQLDIEQIDPAALIKESASVFLDSAIRNGISLQLGELSTDATFPLDSRRIRQVLYNLIGNAVKFTPEGGLIWITAYSRSSTAGRVLSVSVADSGQGVAAEDQERIFEAFEQSGESTDAKAQGTGLGLALAKSYVELHGGTIHVKSDGIGEGSKFVVEIPDRKMPPTNP